MQTHLFHGLLLILTLASCTQADKQSSHPLNDMPANNLLSDLSPEELGAFQWMHPPTSFSLENGTLQVVAEKETDFFNNPEDGTITSTAPLLYREMSGDFVVKALVQPDFSSMWNAVALMVHLGDKHWIKFAFENSDATGPSIVTVVTKGVSDDANGVILDGKDQIWLKLIRKGNIFSMLWSIDGKAYKMARLTAMPAADSVKIGIEAQCPVGESATHEVMYFGVEKKTVADLRKGE